MPNSPLFGVREYAGIFSGSDRWTPCQQHHNFGEVEEAAYTWAKDNFKTTTLLVDKSGNFKRAGTALQPEEFAVLWLFYTETNTLPESFLIRRNQEGRFLIIRTTHHPWASQRRLYGCQIGRGR